MENLEELLLISQEGLDEATLKKKAIDNHQLTPTLYSVLREMKERIVLNHNMSHEEEPQDPGLMRLDNMLVAEGVATDDAAASQAAAALSGCESIIENQEYKSKLREIRSVYHTELARYHTVSANE